MVVVVVSDLVFVCRLDGLLLLFDDDLMMLFDFDDVALDDALLPLVARQSALSRSAEMSRVDRRRRRRRSCGKKQKVIFRWLGAIVF